MGTRVIMPLLGESVIEGKISQWLKQVGDHVKLYEPILEVETDKVTTEVAANGEGTLLKTYFDEGEVVKVGTLIAFLGEPNEVPPDEGGAEHKEQAAQPQAVPAMTAVASAQRGGNGSGTRVSPVVARIAAEHNIDVSALTGTGEGGRVTKKDILAYIDSGASTAAPAAASLPAQTQPVVPAPAVMPGETIALNSMRRSIAEHMVMSKRTSPHVTTVFEVDLSRVVTHRNANQAAFERDGAKLTFTPYFAAATVAALKAHPLVNSSWSEAGIVLHR
jgi:pyruvate/2-oxoglutarate dehydrogenase complex dihydrolipoamide acyltransferase (E2) component